MPVKRQDIYKLCLAGLFIAMNIAAARLLSYNHPSGAIRISPQFIVVGLSGWVLGPAWAMSAAMMGDILGMAIFPSPHPFLPLIAVAAGFRGWIYGAFLYKRKISTLRNYAAIFTTWIICDLAITTYAVARMRGFPFHIQLFERLLPTLIMFAISMLTLTALMHALKKPISYMEGNFLHES